MEINGAKIEVAGIKMVVSPISLTPAELETASGLSTTLQRVWRRRGEIPQRTSGHATFSPQDVASIAIAVALNKFGYTPSEAMQFGNAYHSVVMRCALERGGACEVIGTREGLRKFRTQFDEDLSFLAALVGQRNLDNAWLLCSLDGEAPRLTNRGFGNFDTLPNTFGYFVNLQAIGGHLLDVAARPLLKIQLDSEGGGKAGLIRNII